MEEQIKQITEKKVTQREATLIMAFTLLEVLKKIDEIDKRTQDVPLQRKLLFGAVGTILTAVLLALVAVVVTAK